MVNGSEVSIALKINIVLKVNSITSWIVLSILDKEEFLRQGENI